MSFSRIHQRLTDTHFKTLFLKFNEMIHQHISINFMLFSCNQIKFLRKGPSIKYVMLFWTNFDPLPSVTLCHTSQDPLKYITHLETPLIKNKYLLNSFGSNGTLVKMLTN